VELRATVQKIRYQSPQFWTVAVVRPLVADGIPEHVWTEGHGGHRNAVCAVGVLANMRVGEEVLLRGNWDRTDYGWQLAFSDAEIVVPSDAAGVHRWLEAHLPHVGPKTARRIVEAYGGADRVWAGLRDRPEVLHELLPSSFATAAAEAFVRHQGDRETEAWLRGMGVGPKTAGRLLAEYGERTRKVLQEDPYRLCELDGFGFLSADAIGKALGVAADHPGRARAAVVHVLRLASDKGHTCLPLDLAASRREMHKGGLLQRVEKVGVRRDAAAAVVRAMAGERAASDEAPEGELRKGPELVVDADFVALAELAETEEAAAHAVLEMLG